MTVWYTIKTLDGRTLSRTHGLSIEHKWEWIADIVAADAECSREDVDALENPEHGDIILVKSEPYAKVTTSLHDA